MKKHESIITLVLIALTLLFLVASFIVAIEAGKETSPSWAVYGFIISGFITFVYKGIMILIKNK